MAIGLKTVYPVRTWLRKTLDDVLALGDTIYEEVKTLKPSMKTMTAADLDDARFKVGNQRVSLSEFDFCLRIYVQTCYQTIKASIN